MAYGTTLTDLGRNLVASETTRNQLQAALAAVAAQENIARTQAGSSRYSTDAQREANQLNQAFRAMENQRLRDATQTEAGLRDREMISRADIGRMQFNPNTPGERALDRAGEIEIAKIVAAAQTAQANRIPAQAFDELIRSGTEVDALNAGIESAVAQANAFSDQQFDEIFNGRNWFNRNVPWLGTNDDEARSSYREKAMLIPGQFGETGKYLIPQMSPDGRIRFSGRKLSVPRLGIGSQPTAQLPEPTGPTPSPLAPTINARPMTTAPGGALSIGELSTILGGSNVGVNAPPLRATGIPTSRASASAAALMDPILADAINQVTSRIQELTARGFSPAQAESKARAELPVVVRERLIELHRAMRQ